MRMKLFAVAISAIGLTCVDAHGHNVRMSANMSPYLHLTRTEFLLNDSFPVYQKLIRPELDQRHSRTQFAVGARSKPSSPPRAPLSPYLHLTRKTVVPFFPIYQAIVHPALNGANRDWIGHQKAIPIYPSWTPMDRSMNKSLVKPDLRVFLGSTSAFTASTKFNRPAFPIARSRMSLLGSQK